MPAGRGLASFALELGRRISRAQSMDALTSTATMVGYKAVLLAADTLPRMMPMMMTAAAGTIPPRALVIGAGVAAGCRRPPRGGSGRWSRATTCGRR